MKIKNITPFFTLLGTVWLYLLGLCLVIGLLLVPIGSEHQVLKVIIGIAKVVISMGLILVWLISWYKKLGTIFYNELSKAKNTDAR